MNEPIPQLLDPGMGKIKPAGSRAPIYPFAVIRCLPRRSTQEPKQVIVGVNGTMWQIERGAYVPVPVAVVENLRHSEEPLFIDDEDNPDSGRKKFAGMAMCYPFEVICGLNEDEYKELREKIEQNKHLSDDDIAPYRFKQNAAKTRGKGD